MPRFDPSDLSRITKIADYVHKAGEVHEPSKLKMDSDFIKLILAKPKARNGKFWEMGKGQRERFMRGGNHRRRKG